MIPENCIFHDQVVPLFWKDVGQVGPTGQAVPENDSYIYICRHS